MDELVVERHGPVAWLTVNRPEVRNALSLRLMQRLTQEIRNLARERSVRVIVLTGAGDRVFISGADVGEFREQLATPETALSYDAVAEQLQSALRGSPQPVIAMIQGHAVGSGTIVAASCDFRIAVRTAKFGIMRGEQDGEVALRFQFHKHFPNRNAGDGIETGRGLVKKENLRLVDQTAGDFEPEILRSTVDALAATLAANAPLTIKATKQMIEAMTAPNATVASGAPWYAEIFRSRDFQEGLEAFFSKRKPEFHGE